MRSDEVTDIGPICTKTIFIIEIFLDFNVLYARTIKPTFEGQKRFFKELFPENSDFIYG